MTTVSEAVANRRSIRAFLPDPVPAEVLDRVLAKAVRSPSGGNVQPWRIFVLQGEAMDRFKAHMETALASGASEDLDYTIYPAKLKEPYRSSRFKCGEDMYALLGIAREDKPARLQWLLNNYRFFGAPAGLFCFLDRMMGPPQWSDLGMFLQTVMLLLQEEGIDSCAQESWSRYPKTVADYVGADPDLMLFCGMAIGYRDPDAPVNRLVTDREPADTWLTYL